MTAGAVEVLIMIVGVVLPLTIAGLVYLDRVPTNYWRGPTWSEIADHIRRQRTIPRAVARRRRP